MAFCSTYVRKFGFLSVWINWIKECIVTPSFSVLVNGVSGSSFRPSRGIRQGDPLSPYLFILCAELLARQFAAACRHQDKIIGVRIIGHSGIRIPFLTFANDTMIFAKASSESCHLIHSILDKYCAMSGQLVNYQKSSFHVTGNVSPSDKCLFSEILGMPESNDLGSYSGCPIITSGVSRETLAMLFLRFHPSSLNGRPIRSRKRGVRFLFRQILLQKPIIKCKVSICLSLSLKSLIRPIGISSGTKTPSVLQLSLLGGIAFVNRNVLVVLASAKRIQTILLCSISFSGSSLKIKIACGLN